MRPDLMAVFDAGAGEVSDEEELPEAGPPSRDGTKTPRKRRSTDMGDQATCACGAADAGAGKLTDYQVEVNEGEVVLDVLHRLQATQTRDLAIRWNCKAGKCGSCSMEINGRPGSRA